MTDREIMQQALDALEYHTMQTRPISHTDKAIEALEAALAQPEQTPDAWRNAAIRLGEDLYSVGPDGYYDMTAKQWLDWALGVVNTAPPRKPWVGLTDADLMKEFGYTDELLRDTAYRVQQKLKEKNT